MEFAAPAAVAQLPPTALASLLQPAFQAGERAVVVAAVGDLETSFVEAKLGRDMTN